MQHQRRFKCPSFFIWEFIGDKLCIWEVNRWPLCVTGASVKRRGHAGLSIKSGDLAAKMGKGSAFLFRNPRVETEPIGVRTLRVSVAWQPNTPNTRGEKTPYGDSHPAGYSQLRNLSHPRDKRDKETRFNRLTFLIYQFFPFNSTAINYISFSKRSFAGILGQPRCEPPKIRDATLFRWKIRKLIGEMEFELRSAWLTLKYIGQSSISCIEDGLDEKITVDVCTQADGGRGS